MKGKELRAYDVHFTYMARNEKGDIVVSTSNFVNKGSSPRDKADKVDGQSDNSFAILRGDN